MAGGLTGMMNGKRIALIATVGFCVAVALLWRPVLFVGIPVAVIAGLAAFALHRSYREDDTSDGERMRRWALMSVCILSGESASAA